MRHSTELKKALLSRNPEGVTFKETENKLVVLAPGYSSYSAAFDKGFRLADELGINWIGKNDGWSALLDGKPYTLVFTVTKKTK